MKGKGGMSKGSTQNSLPDGWTQARLADIAIINPKPKKPIDLELEVSFVPMRCVEELTGKIDSSNTMKFKNIKKGLRYFEEYDILFAKITPCMENGKIAIAYGLKNRIGYGSTEFHIIRLLDSKIPQKFYFYYLVQEEFRKNAASKMKGTAGQLRVPTAIISDALVPIPPLKEQHRIVHKIESIFGQIDAAIEIFESMTRPDSGSLTILKNNILKQAFEGNLVEQHLDDKPVSFLLEKIKKENTKHQFQDFRLEQNDPLPNNWIITTLNQITDTVKKIIPENTPNKLFYYCDISSIDNKKFKIVNPKKIIGKNAPSRARQLIQKNDILFSTVRTHLKNIAIVPDKFDGQLASTGFCIIRPLPKTIPKFIFYYIMSDRFISIINARQIGVSYPAVRNKDVLNAAIRFPPFSEQRRIVSKIESIFAKIDSINEIIQS
ncbi:MAG: restriction endonuclease subunit S, partial [Hyphomicrobiaceae bacterium]|nr:restriction endonuclease subunit S [Hyphomicrobiaceae bacterium]